MCDLIERHDPIGKTDYLSIQHVERYRFALSRLSPGQRVLDIACGAGYGLAMLSEYGCDPIGADYDRQGLVSARAAWGHDPFIQSDALALPFEIAERN